MIGHAYIAILYLACPIIILKLNFYINLNITEEPAGIFMP